MPEQIYIGNFAKGQVTARLPFVIDNDAFPTLNSAYVWRGRAKRKRGTIFLGQLQIQLQSVVSPNNWQKGKIGTLDGGGAFSGNLVSIFGLGSTASITPGSFTLSDGTNTYTEPTPQDGTLVGAPGGTGTINYATGDITITGGAAGGNLIGTFSYFPGLPVMGLRDFVSLTTSSNYPLLLSFDTKYAYQINQTGTNVFFYDVSYYKTSNNPVVWTGGDFQQFWTTNYEGAFWATNNKPGFQFKLLTNTLAGSKSVLQVSATQVTVGLTSHGLVNGDYLWFNEVAGTIGTGSGATQNQNINGQTGKVTVVDANTLTVDFTGATGTSTANFQGGAVGTGGIAQYLTQSVAGKGDGIRWYDGDPTAGTGLPTGSNLGWVNFAPPLTGATVIIDDLPAALYYLVGALAIVPFKDRLLFFSPWVQTSTGAAIQLQDAVIWSWNGAPYYTALTPVNQTNNFKAYYQDQTGLGGNLPAGIDKPITTVSNNEDVLLVGFGGTGRKTRLTYTGNDISPFLFFTINSELPSDCTFSAITLDKGAIDIGAYGIAMTDQQSCQRIDLDIPDSVFQIQALNNGVQRVNAVRDFFKEWIFFSYPISGSPWKFPTQTFLFNYRDNTWGTQYENFTTHGTYRPQKKKTWKTTGFRSWNTWREAWNSGSGSVLFPNIVAGNPQGYVLIKGQGTGEGISGTIQAITANGGETQITSIDHCVQQGDYLYITGCLGTTAINTLIGRVRTTVDKDNFVIDLPFPAGTYLGLGKFTRLSQPLIQTKQFPVYWDQGRQTRLSVQKYLMDFTVNSQVTVNVYLSQDPDDAWNSPQSNPPPNGLVYSQLMYTCPESSNIGLTAANTNLQMPTAQGQYQIWHRFNTSLIGDSVQIGITLSDAQMRNLTYATSEITLHGIHLTVDKGPHLA